MKASNRAALAALAAALTAAATPGPTPTPAALDRAALAAQVRRSCSTPGGDTSDTRGVTTS